MQVVDLDLLGALLAAGRAAGDEGDVRATRPGGDGQLGLGLVAGVDDGVDLDGQQAGPVVGVDELLDAVDDAVLVAGANAFFRRREPVVRSFGALLHAAALQPAVIMSVVQMWLAVHTHRDGCREQMRPARVPPARLLKHET